MRQTSNILNLAIQITLPAPLIPHTNHVTTTDHDGSISVARTIIPAHTPPHFLQVQERPETERPDLITALLSINLNAYVMMGAKKERAVSLSSSGIVEDEGYRESGEEKAANIRQQSANLKRVLFVPFRISHFAFSDAYSVLEREDQLSGVSVC
jgi:hypothetical protein